MVKTPNRRRRGGHVRRFLGGFLETITDFDSGVDRLDLSGLGTDASHVFFSGDDVLIASTHGTADLAIRSGAEQIQLSDILFG